MTNAIRRAATNMPDECDRCRTCDGLAGRDAYASSEVVRRTRPVRVCPDCGGRTSPCDACHRWLAFGLFRNAGSNVCTLCVDRKKQQRPWTAAEGSRLAQAVRDALDLWPRYVDQWSEEEMEVWRNLLAAVERLPRNEL